MTTPDLKPQIPGNVLNPGASAPRDPLLDLAKLPPSKLIPMIAKLPASDLQALASHERAGRKRESVLKALEKAMHVQVKPAPKLHRSQLGRAVEQRPHYGGKRLTANGWEVYDPRGAA